MLIKRMTLASVWRMTWNGKRVKGLNSSNTSEKFKQFK